MISRGRDEGRSLDVSSEPFDRQKLCGQTQRLRQRSQPVMARRHHCRTQTTLCQYLYRYRPSLPASLPASLLPLPPLCVLCTELLSWFARTGNGQKYLGAAYTPPPPPPVMAEFVAPFNVSCVVFVCEVVGRCSSFHLKLMCGMPVLGWSVGLSRRVAG